MSTKTIKIFSFLSILFVYGCTSQRPPNIVFVLVDDLGWNDLGCYGSTFYETPNLDKMASQGMMFTDAYAASPVCSPTRASIMTGKYPSRLNITDWIPGQNPKNTKLIGPQDLDELPLEELTIAERLKENGYKTFFAGKWHLGDDGFFPEDQGFELNKGGHHKGSPPGGYYSPYKNPKLEDGPEGEYLPDRLTEESIQFMKENKENPFLLYLSYYTVHTPIQASKRHLDKFKKKAIELLDEQAPIMIDEHEGSTVSEQYNPSCASMVYAMDENVGRLLDQIEKQGLSDNTIVIFTSDNGGLSTLGKNRKAPTSVKPLRAGKGWCYEGGIRVPLIVKAPERMEITGASNFPVISNDFYPTIMEMAGIAKLPGQELDGQSIVPLLSGEEKIEREAIFWHYPHYHGSMWTPGAAIRMGDWKLIEFYHHGKTELYNLKDDLGESNDISGKYPDKVKELKSRLKQMQIETKSKFPIPNPDFIEEGVSKL